MVRATARVYGKGVEDLRRKRRGEENEARSMAMHLSRVLGGHKHSEIGGALGLEKTSSVSSACLRMKRRIETEKHLARRARDIQKSIIKEPKADLTPEQALRAAHFLVQLQREYGTGDLLVGVYFRKSSWTTC